MHRFTFLSLIASLLSFTSAINFTYPNSNITLSRGSTYDVTWSSVDTDPTQFSIYLWNFLYYPPYYTFLTQVQTSAHSQNITIPCNVPSEDGWQFTAISGTNVYVIYAQTHNFTIDATQCSSPTVGPNPEGQIVTQTVTSTVNRGGATSTVTKTVTKSGGKSTITTCTGTGSVATSTVTQNSVSTTTTTSLVALLTSTVTDIHTKTACGRHRHPPGQYARRTAA